VQIHIFDTILQRQKSINSIFGISLNSLNLTFQDNTVHNKPEE